MNDDDLIRRGDALAAVANLYKWSIAAGEELEDAIAALPAVTVDKEAFMAAVWDALKADANDLRKQQRVLKAFLAALEPVTQPAPDAAAIREAWERAYWRLRSYAVHDNDCKLNKPPHFDGPCSCGLTAALEEVAALITEKPHDRA